jgi:plasmid stability protein
MRLAFLRKRVEHVKATYVHRQGRTVEQIRREAELRSALVAVVTEQRFPNLSALAIRDQLLAHVRSTGRLRWALEPAPGIDLSYRLQNALDLLSLPLGLVAVGPVVIPAAIVLLVLVRLQEQRDPIQRERPSPELVHTLTTLEDYAAQNGFTAGGYVKPGWVRRAAVSSLLPLIGWGSRHLFTQDSLAGVKSIHFARWVPLDGGRRVVFVSNYDGSLESYNNDFIDLVAWGLNLIFSNGLGYPSTRWLVLGGARYEQDFKDFLRSHQVPTPVWYSAYPHLSARNVERNAKLRAGLHGHMTEQEAQTWLSLL